MPKVSIIVPVYKVESYLHQCVESILAQTYKDYEVLLVDDGSPDNCGKICDEYAARDNRIRVIHKENGGLSDARNAGLDAASGKYIYFLDSDDCVVPDLLECIVPKLEAGADLVVFNYFRLYEDGKQEQSCLHSTGNYKLQDEKSRVDFIIKVLLSGKLGWEAWSRIYVREKIEQYGLRFEDNRKIFAEDLYFSLCYCAHAELVHSIDDCLYCYRVREDSIMGIQQKKVNIGRICKLSDAVEKYYQKCADCSMLLKYFDIIRMQIILKQFSAELWTTILTPEEFRNEVWNCVPDKSKLERQTRKLLKEKKLSQVVGSFTDALDLKSHARFMLGGSWMMLRLCCKAVRLLRNGRQGE